MTKSEAVFEVKNIIEDIFYNLDKANIPGAVSHFGEEAKLIISKNHQVQEVMDGKQQILEALTKKTAVLDLLLHVGDIQHVELDEMLQNAAVDTKAVIRIKDSQQEAAKTEYVHYEDKLIYSEGEWYILWRTVVIEDIA